MKEIQGDRRIRIIGSGFREHALFELASRSPQTSYVDIAPGNAATQRYNVPIQATDIPSQVKDAKARNIDTVIVGPEDPLAMGIGDRMKDAGIDVLGPNAQEAQIEASKWFAIELMQAAQIPHPKTKLFYNWDSARDYIRTRGSQNIVVKEDGLRGGKGVTVPNSLEEAEDALDKAFGKRETKHLLIQDRIDGNETSFMAFVDGEHIVPLLPSQDFKRAGDGDTGPNTGGMGAIAPDKKVNEDLTARILKEIMYPIVFEMKKRGMNYKGILYAGLMIDKDGNISVIEFNCRAGNPEFPVVKSLLAEDFDLIGIADSIRLGTLNEGQVQFMENMVAVGIVGASEGYPDRPIVGRQIQGLDEKLGPDSFLFQGETKVVDGKIITNGGRVVLAVGRGSSFIEAKALATSAIDKVVFEGKIQRKDIGS